MTAQSVRELVRQAIAGETPLADRGSEFHAGRVHALRFVEGMLDEINEAKHQAGAESKESASEVKSHEIRD